MSQFDKKFDRSITGTRKWNPDLLKEKNPIGNNIIAMDLADIDFECAPSIREALVNRALMPDYSYTFVPDSFYDAVINWNKKYFNLDIKKEWVRLTFGTISALHNIVQALTDVGDYVMIHTPAYAPFAESVIHNGRKLICNDLILTENRYYIDFDKMESDIIKYNVKLFILCNPQNPSGRVWTAQELNQLGNICKRNQVYLISDEIHRDIVFPNSKFTSLWNANDNVMDSSILCVSPNKGFNLGGLKTSYIVVPNKSLREKIYARLSANYVTSPHVFAVPAIEAAYRYEHEWLEEMVTYIEENHNYVEDFIQKNLPKFKLMKAESSFLAWIYVGDYFETEEEISKFFQRANLTVVLGSYFVSNAEGFVRLNIGMQRYKVEEAFNRIKKMYDSYK